MIFRLCASRLTLSASWQKVLSTQIPKIHHHTLITSSSSLSCKSLNKLNEAKLFHQKQQQPQRSENESVIKAVVKSIRSNPYVRIARLDRPIGKFSLINYYS